MWFHSFSSAALMLVVFSFFVGGAVKAEAQDLSAGLGSAGVEEKQTCGPAVSLPEGSTVVRLDDMLRVTLPYGYVYAGIQSDGLPLFVESLSVPPNFHGPALESNKSFLGETIYIDCICNDRDGGTCVETYNIITGNITCPSEDCDNCFKVIIRLGES